MKPSSRKKIGTLIREGWRFILLPQPTKPWFVQSFSHGAKTWTWT